MSVERPCRHSPFETLKAEKLGGMLAWLSDAKLEIMPTQEVAKELAVMPMDRIISVTSSPTKSMKDTLLLSEALIKSGRKVMPHIAARYLTNPKHITEVMGELKGLRVEEILLIAGDNSKPSGDFEGSLGILREIQNQNIHFERINIAGYPEGHPKISQKVLDENLLLKQAWAQETKTEMSIITQMCFDAKTIVKWIERLRDIGVKLPIVVGVPGNGIDPNRLLNFAQKSGVGGSIRFLTSKPGFVFSLGKAAITRFDTDKFLVDLGKRTRKEHNVNGIHIFTFNEILSTEEWIKESKDFLK